jgi:hypothetical protein
MSATVLVTVIGDVGFEGLTAVVMESSIFWNLMPCSPLKVNSRFEGTCRLHLQCRRISKAIGSAYSLFVVTDTMKLR